MTPKVTIVGSINLDLVVSGAALPRPGETVTGARFAQHPGGKGANQALAARRLGADVALIGCVGDDALAESALALLRRDGVDVSRVMSQIGEPTGVALIAVSPEGENQITVASGANMRVSADDARGLPVCDVVLCQMEVPFSAVEAAAERSREVNAMFAVNLAPALPVSEHFLNVCDLIIVNEIEAAFYGEALHQGNRMVALTLGGQGAVLYKAGQEIARSPAFDVPVVDTTGAGDTFCGALAVALAEGQPPQKALRFASAAAALAVTTPGAQPSLPTRKAVEDLLLATRI